MKAKKVLVLLLDVIVVAIIAVAMMSKTSITNNAISKTNNLLAENTDLSFDLIASPEEKRVKAGETVEITLSVKDIKIGEEGLNSIVGYLGYDEKLFDSMKIEGIQDWKIELNQIKNHGLYGKFCIYTMKEGVTENEDVVKMTLKLKDDLKPQTTKVTFTKLASSDGEVEVPEEDREVRIIIYEDEPGTPDETTEDEPGKPVQTGDNKILVVIAVAILTIVLNILTFVKGSKSQKGKILSTILIMVLGLSCAKMVSYAAENMNVAEVLNKLNIKESWLNSEEYLVTEENVSRIAPGTKVENIKSQFNKEIVVKKDGKEVKDGIIGTGMKISVKNPSSKDAEGNYAYEVSVWGDTNGDGKSNQVELTKIIRNVVDKEKWNITGATFKSADLTVDNKINEKDVQASVKYIVYGEMEIPEFEQVEAPTIEVVEGEFDKEFNCYTTDVKVKITEQAKNGAKTQYKVENSRGIVTKYTEISREQMVDGKYTTIITLPKDEIYKVSAYTTGELGNRSEIPYEIICGVYNKYREYRVEYYYKGLNDEEAKIDNEKTEKEYAEIGEKITTYTDKNKRGYQLDKVEGLPLTISRNTEENVIKVYYNIVHYGITYNTNGGEWPNGENPNPTVYTVETPTITITNPEKEGYEIVGWVEDEGDVPEDPKTIPLGTVGEIELTAEWEPKDYNYIVEYYYDGELSTEITDGGTAKYKSTIEEYTILEESKLEGYTLDTTKGTNGIEGLPLTIGIDETKNKIKVYYKLNEGALVIHHYKNGTITKVAKDEVIELELGNTYEITSLLSNENKIKVNGIEQTEEREYINSEKYTFAEVQSENENITIGNNGIVTGTAYKEMGAITYYYNVRTFTINGRVKSGNGSIEGIPEEVEYGENANNIVIKPETGNRLKKLTIYSGQDDSTEGRDITNKVSKRSKKIIDELDTITEDKYLVAEFEEAEIVAKIVAIPDGMENFEINGHQVLGHEYTSLEDAIAEATATNKERDIEGKTGSVEIQILSDIDGETNKISGADTTQENKIIIDINGHTISANSDQEPVIAVEDNGNLTIVDRSEDQTGAIINETGVAIEVDVEGSLTLGEKENNVNSIPDTTPVIQGGTYGIMKQKDETAEQLIDDITGEPYYPEGTFNFYDGKIIGGTAALNVQRIDDTPSLYDPTLRTNSETGNQESTLAIVTGIEAVIGRRRYLYLEDAIEAANNLVGTSDEQVEITIVAEITKNNPIIMDNTKNIKLDLNGHTVTNLVSSESTDKYFNTIENYGKLEIVDSSEYIDETTGEKVEGTGKITNAGTSNLTSSGQQQVIHEYKYAIYNGVGTLEEGNYENIDLNTCINLAEGREGYLDPIIENNIIKIDTPVWDLKKILWAVPVDLSNKEGKYAFEMTYVGGGAVDAYVAYENREDGCLLWGLYGSDTEKVSTFMLEGGKKYNIIFKSTSKPNIEVSSIKYKKEIQPAQLVLTSGTIEGDNRNNYLLGNLGNVQINDTKLIVKQEETGSSLKYVKNYGGDINISDKAMDAEEIIVVQNSAGGSLNVDNTNLYSVENYGKLDANKLTTQHIFNSGNAKIENCDVMTGLSSSTGSETYVKNTKLNNVQNSGTMTIESADMTEPTVIINNYQRDYEIKNNDGTLTINNINLGSTSNQNRINIENGAVIINNGEIYGNVTIAQDGELTINNGDIISTGEYAISSAGTTIINNGNIQAKKYVIQTVGETAVTEIYGGKLNATDETSYGVYTAGSLKIGEDDGDVKTDSPEIKCKTSAIYNYGNKDIEFYDGVLIGKPENVIQGAVSKIAAECDMLKETKEDGLQYITLGIPDIYVSRISATYTPDTTNINQNMYKLEDGYYYFKSINSAVDAAKENVETTVEIIENDFSQINTINVTANQKVIIDLNGNTIRNLADYMISNNGTLTIKNTSQNGKIIQNDKHLLKDSQGATTNINNVVLELSNGITNNNKNIIDINGTFNAENSTLLTITGGETSVININNSILNDDVVCNSNVQGNAITVKNTTVKHTIVVNSGNALIENVSSMNLNSESYNITSTTSGTIEIKDSNKYIIDHDGTGTVVLKGTSSSTSNSYIKNGTLKVEIAKDSENNIRNINGTVEATSGKISITNAGTANIKGDNVTLQGTVTNSGTMTITAGKAVSQIRNSGNLTITNGNIRDGIVNTAESAELTLGTKDGEVAYTPIVYGGVSNASGKFYFYDGIIDGAVNESIIGSVTAQEISKGIVNYTGATVFDDGTQDGYTVESGREISVLQSVGVVTLSSNNMEYGSLEEAIQAAATTDTITLIKDITVTTEAESATVPANKNITINLNGKTLSTSNDNTIINNGTLKITDSAETKGSITTNGQSVINNNGTLTLEDCNLIITSAGTRNEYKNMITNTAGTININNGALLKAETNYVELVNSTQGTININQGAELFTKPSQINAMNRIINSTQTQINVAEGAVLTAVSRSSDSSKDSSNIYSTNGEINISGGTLTGVLQEQGGTITVTGGTIEKWTVGGGTMNISGGTLTGDGSILADETVKFYGNAIGTANIEVGEDGTFLMEGGTLNLGDTANVRVIGNAKITGGTINSNHANIYTSMKSATAVGNIEIEGNDSENPLILNTGISAQYGNVSIKGYVEINSQDIGMYMSEVSRVTIGDKNNIANNVKITAQNEALVQRRVGKTHLDMFGKGEFKYYGGTLKGTSVDLGRITDFPDGYTISKTESGSTITRQIEAETGVATNGTTEYATLQEAFNNNESGTITLLKDIWLGGSENPIEIPATKNFVLDLAGKTIETNCGGSLITNKGTLQITDSIGNAKIQGKADKVVYNTGNLTIDEIEISMTGTGVSEKYIYNTENGNVTLNGTTITENSTQENTLIYTSLIYTNSTGNVNVNANLNQNNKGYSIYTEYANDSEPVKVNLTGGNIRTVDATGTQSIFVDNNCTLNISGNADIERSTIKVFKNSNTNITAGTLNNTIIKREGTHVLGDLLTVNITGGTLKDSYVDSDGAEVNISGTANINSSEMYQMFINKAADVVIKDVSIIGGIAAAGSVTIENATITGTTYGIQNASIVYLKSGKVEGQNGYGIVAGSIYLGEKPLPVSTEKPEVIGSTYGLYVNSINFFDGIVKGGTAAIRSGTVSNTPDKFEVTYSEDRKEATLRVIATYNNFATVNGQVADNLQDAITAAAANGATIMINAEAAVEQTATVPAGANITIDLNGKSIYGYSEQPIIINNGTLTIIDSTNTADVGIYNFSGPAIQNNGTIVMGVNDGTTNQNTPVISGTPNAITGSGTITTYDGKVENAQ